MSDLALNGNNSPINSSVHSADHVQHDAFSADDLDQNTQDVSLPTASVDDDSSQHYDGPPSKKQKVVDASSHKSSPREPSPPWKKITADGPTSFVENGRRRSGRTNIIPLEHQSHSARRQTRAAYDKMLDRHNRPSYNVNSKPKTEKSPDQKKSIVDKPIRKGPGRPPKVKIDESMKHAVQPASPSSKRRAIARETRRSPILRRNGYLRSTGEEDNYSRQSSSTPSLSSSPSPPLTLQRVKFRVALPQPSILTPANAPPPRKYASFKQFLEQDQLEPFAGQDILSTEQIKKEANIRLRVHEAQRSGQITGSKSSHATIDKQTEAPRQFAHHDHLLGHVLHFRTLLRQERRDHKRKAEQLAHEAKRYLEEKRRRGHVKSAEELAQEFQERMRIQYRQVAKDMDRLWLAVQAEVNSIRQRRFEEEQRAKIKSHLNRVLERTDEMLLRREGSEMTSDIDSGTADPTEDGSDESDSEVMSSSSSSSATDMVDAHDPDEDLTAEELRAKYEDLQDPNGDQETEDNEAGTSIGESGAEDSDPDIEMDSEFSSEDDSRIEDEDGTEDEDDGDGLLSLFFSKDQISAMANQQTPDETVINSEEVRSASEFELATSNVIGSDIDLHKGEQDSDASKIRDVSAAYRHKPLITDVTDHMVNETEQTLSSSSPAPNVLAEDATSLDASHRTSPDTLATKQSDPESISSPEPHADKAVPNIELDDRPSIRTPVPPLLRGTLRQYQHEGLDWLANLYANGRSGILADEMGLGKTIQSIALLAHLASEYEIWGPHLIVVPTSVMLNWEMEFKKFLPGFKILTYYGSLEERKQKRRGWMAGDSFNVCITSYQLVLQDANSFKRRRWHYMILDEAHNIKNFRSERWQTMMTFNTRARLLLTGTPLQNNLTELWSLLFFLHYGQEGEDDDEAFAGLKEWSEWFKRPVESILEHGRQVLDQEDKEQVAKLHKVIRPFLLRRLKADVEKQMPAKYEHVEICRLSKRQRQLYDGFMSRAQTKETLASGNYLSIINALMQLRKVCNHPDLFETRPINTSYAMPKSVAVDFEIQDLLLRRQLLSGSPLDDVDLDFLQLVPISNENISLIENIETVRRHAYHPFKALRDSQWSRVNRHALPIGQKRQDILASLEHIGRKTRLQDIDRTMYYEAYRHHQRPIYGRGLLQKLDFGTTYSRLSKFTETGTLPTDWSRDLPVTSLGLVQSVRSRSQKMQPLIEQYACVTPAVVTNDMAMASVTEAGAVAIRQELKTQPDPFHQARMKLSIAFPDKRLLQYDCGKLQRLDRLLRELHGGGHRALIFTQMTKVLDILEQFLNIHGHRYLRLDGATKIEQRQILTDRFNNDTRILCFILSSRSGGLGINLTGADTVIFYDLDWNPAMDRQCTDRAHRIGQTRDVHIYRFVSEHTIESNILRKANQKQMLDDVVIQEGDFTTDYTNRLTYRDMLDDQAEDDVAGAAMDRVLGNNKHAVAAFEQAEDHEDASAAKVAAKEVQHADEGDFEDKIAATPRTGESDTPGPSGTNNAAIPESDKHGLGHIDDYLMRLQTFLFKDVPLAPPKDRAKRGRKRGDEHRKRRPR